MDWRTILDKNVTTVEDLRLFLPMSEEEAKRIRKEIRTFPMSVSDYYLSLIRTDDPNDPIRKMAIPSGMPLDGDGSLDTSGEQQSTRIRGLQHKYEQTAMILTTSECAMFCRHCFRRRLVGKETEEIAAEPQEVLDYLRSHPAINNVLLSGGDAFLMDTEKIENWLELLSQLPQLDFIRFGTRTPVTFPQRILLDPLLGNVLREYGKQKQIYVVTHFNHPREMTLQAMGAIRTLQASGVVVKNQTVLLKGINDDPAVLGELLRKISSWGIVQHYIFQCRPVQGVKTQFQVPLLEGMRIVDKALGMQNGLGKSAGYAMSHHTGKIQVLGEPAPGKMIFQYKQARDPENIGRLFSRKIQPDDTWLPGGLIPDGRKGQRDPRFRTVLTRRDPP